MHRDHGAQGFGNDAGAAMRQFLTDLGLPIYTDVQRSKAPRDIDEDDQGTCREGTFGARIFTERPHHTSSLLVVTFNINPCLTFWLPSNLVRSK